MLLNTIFHLKELEMSATNDGWTVAKKRGGGGKNPKTSSSAPVSDKWTYFTLTCFKRDCEGCDGCQGFSRALHRSILLNPVRTIPGFPGFTGCGTHICEYGGDCTIGTVRHPNGVNACAKRNHRNFHLVSLTIRTEGTGFRFVAMQGAFPEEAPIPQIVPAPPPPPPEEEEYHHDDAEFPGLPWEEVVRRVGHLQGPPTPIPRGTSWADIAAKIPEPPKAPEEFPALPGSPQVAPLPKKMEPAPPVLKEEPEEPEEVFETLPKPAPQPKKRMRLVKMPTVLAEPSDDGTLARLIEAQEEFLDGRRTPTQLEKDWVASDIGDLLKTNADLRERTKRLEEILDENEMLRARVSELEADNAYLRESA